MKKVFAIFAAMFLLLCGCANVEKEGESKEESMFVQIEQTDYWRIVYNKDTRVMYAISDGAYNRGNFFLLVNPEGTPMLWED